MKRGSHWVTRLVLLGIAVAMLTVAVNPAVRWTIERSAESMLGGDVQVGHVSTSYKHALIVMHNFRASDPTLPTREMFTAKHVELQLDPAALARKKFVVERGVFSGFRMGTELSSIGPTSAKDRDAIRESLQRKQQDINLSWIDQASNLLSEELEGDFQTVALAKQFAERWPREYAELTKVAQETKQKIEVLRRTLDESGENPLRNIASYQQAVTDIEALRRELAEVQGRLRRMAQQMEMDRQALAKAKSHDERLAKSPLPLTISPADECSEFLLGPEMTTRMAGALEWLRWGRVRFPQQNTASMSLRRGSDILFAGKKPTPDILLKSVVLRGEGTFGGETMAIEGVIKGLSSHPQLADDPTEITIQTVDGPSMLIHVVLDDRAEERHDEVVIDWPQLSLPQTVLGHPEELALALGAGRAHWWFKARLNGDQLSGDMVLKQSQPKLTALLPPQYTQLTQHLNNAVRDIQSLETRVTISGTIHAPQWTLSSNLGSDLATAFERSVAESVNAERARKLHAAIAYAEGTFNDLFATFKKQNDWATKELELGHAEINRVHESIASRVELPDGIIDKSSPLRETYRR